MFKLNVTSSSFINQRLNISETTLCNILLYCAGNVNWLWSICLFTGATDFCCAFPVSDCLSLFSPYICLGLYWCCSLIICKCDCLTDSCCLRNYCKPKWDTTEYMQSLVNSKNSKPLKAWLYLVFPRSECFVYLKRCLK